MCNALAARRVMTAHMYIQEAAENEPWKVALVWGRVLKVPTGGTFLGGGKPASVI
jgi:hypothetical protein